MRNVEVLAKYGADPRLPNRLDERSAVTMAARRGRRDLLDLFERRGVSLELAGVDRLIAACARHDVSIVRAISQWEPALVVALLEEGGPLLAEFAGTGNTEGVRALLDLGVPPGALYGGDGYFDIAAGSTALHVAAWKAWPQTVALLIERGTPVDALDGRGRSALMLAVKACVDSYWVDRRTPVSVRALLAAGASVAGVSYPSGYAAVDGLLAPYFGEVTSKG